MKKTLVAICAVLCWGLAAAPVRAAEPAATPEVQRAETLIDGGKNAEAIELLNTYIAAHPRDQRALADRGDANYNLKKREDAIADYSAAITIDPTYTYAYTSRCQTYYDLDKDDLALPDCSKAIEIDAESSYAYRTRALVYLDLNKVDEAIADSDKAVKYGDGNAANWADACNVQYVAKHYETASKDCAQALEIDPRSYPARLFTGRLELRNEDWFAADGTFTKLIADFGENTLAHYYRGIARYHLKRNEDAIADMTVYINSHTDDGDGYYLRAMMEEQAGNFASAKDDATTALKRYKIAGDDEGITDVQDLLTELDAESGHRTR